MKSRDDMTLCIEEILEEAEALSVRDPVAHLVVRLASELHDSSPVCVDLVACADLLHELNLLVDQCGDEGLRIKAVALAKWVYGATRTIRNTYPDN